MVRKGQSGTEFLAVTGIGMLLLVGVSFFLLSDSKASRDQAVLRQVNQIGGELLSQSRVVQSQGKNSWITVEANLPETVSAMYTTENDTLVFDVNTLNGPVSQPIFSLVPITGTRIVGPRAYIDNGTNFHTGTVRFTVYSNGTHVQITMR